MNGTKNDIDPATELREEDEEPVLPELESDMDLAAGAGPLAAGRAVILNHAKLAPSSPGVYRMIDAKGDVLYVGKAKNIRKRIIAYARPTGYDPRIERMIAATAALEFVSTATETEALYLELLGREAASATDLTDVGGPPARHLPDQPSADLPGGLARTGGAAARWRRCRPGAGRPRRRGRRR